MKDIKEVRAQLEQQVYRVLIGSFNKPLNEDKKPFIKLDGFNGQLLFLPKDQKDPLVLKYLNIGKALPSKDGTVPDFVLGSVFIREEGPEDNKLINIGSLQSSKREGGRPFIKVDHFHGTLLFQALEDIDNLQGTYHKIDHLFLDAPLPGAPDFVIHSVVIKVPKE